MEQNRRNTQNHNPNAHRDYLDEEPRRSTHSSHHKKKPSYTDQIIKILTIILILVAIVAIIVLVVSITKSNSKNNNDNNTNNNTITTAPGQNAEPTKAPTKAETPNGEPTAEATPEPTETPANPTEAPTANPTATPTQTPANPTATPTPVVTQTPAGDVKIDVVGGKYIIPTINECPALLSKKIDVCLTLGEEVIWTSLNDNGYYYNRTGMKFVNNSDGTMTGPEDKIYTIGFVNVKDKV